MTRTATLKPNEVKELTLTAVVLDPENIRKTFDQASLKELAADIKLRGIEQPITVTPNGKGYVIKHGARRYLAAKLAKLKTVPCILGKKETGDDAEFKRLADQWAENMLREDLNPIDIAEFFKTCRDEYEMTAKQIPEYLQSYGIKCEYNESTIRGMIRLVELPDWAKEYIRAGKLTASHGRAILPATRSPNVLKDLKKEIDDYMKRLDNQGLDALMEYDEVLTVCRLQNAVDDIFQHHHPRANTFDDRYTWLAEEKRVLYDVNKLDKETMEKLNLVELNDGNNNKEIYILNTQLHQELQKKAKAEIASRGKSKSGSSGTSGSTTSKSKSNGSGADSKPEPKTEASEDRLEKWLHLYLTQWIKNKFHSMTPEQRAPIFEKILIWCAIYFPGNAAATHLEHNLYRTCKKAMDVNEIGSILNGTHTLEHVQNLIVENLLLPQGDNQQYANLIIDLTNTITLAAHLGFNIDTDITIDADFAEMYTGAGIEKLVHQAKLQDNPMWKEAVKTAQKRTYAVSAAKGIGTPKPVKKLWQDTVKQ